MGEGEQAIRFPLEPIPLLTFRPSAYGGFTVRRLSERGTNGARNIGLIKASGKFAGARHKPIDLEEMREILTFMESL
jgi:hypothetical protein